MDIASCTLVRTLSTWPSLTVEKPSNPAAARVFHTVLRQNVANALPFRPLRHTAKTRLMAAACSLSPLPKLANRLVRRWILDTFVVVRRLTQRVLLLLAWHTTFFTLTFALPKEADVIKLSVAGVTFVLRPVLPNVAVLLRKLPAAQTVGGVSWQRWVPALVTRPSTFDTIVAQLTVTTMPEFFWATRKNEFVVWSLLAGMAR